MTQQQDGGLILGLDLGTTFFKAGVFTPQGQLRGLGRVAVAREEGDGRCELPFERFWAVLREAVAEALAQAATRPGAVSAIGYSSQANSFLLLDESVCPLTPIILWPDRRAPVLAEPVEQLWRRTDFLATTGLGFGSPELCVNKLLWFRAHEPDLWRKTRYIMTISDYLTYGLTAQRVGDQGTAALLGLWDLRNECWWAEGLAGLGLPSDHLSTPLRPGSRAGVLDETGTCRLGLPPGIPLVVGSLDHHMAAVGAGIGQWADCCESTGTVLACMRLCADWQPRAGCCMGPGLQPGSFYQLAFNESGASGLDWYRAAFAPELDVPTLLQLAQTAPAGCEGLGIRPGFQRHPPETAFLHRNADHTHAHCVRAILEANADDLARLLDELYPCGWPERLLATGGGARSEFWLQLKADRLGLEFGKTDCAEPACRGAALLATPATSISGPITPQSTFRPPIRAHSTESP